MATIDRVYIRSFDMSSCSFRWSPIRVVLGLLVYQRVYRVLSMLVAFSLCNQCLYSCSWVPVPCWFTLSDPFNSLATTAVCSTHWCNSGQLLLLCIILPRKLTRICFLVDDIISK